MTVKVECDGQRRHHHSRPRSRTKRFTTKVSRLWRKPAVKAAVGGALTLVAFGLFFLTRATLALSQSNANYTVQTDVRRAGHSQEWVTYPGVSRTATAAAPVAPTFRTMRLPMVVGQPYVELSERIGPPDKVKGDGQADGSKVWVYSATDLRVPFHTGKGIFDTEREVATYFGCKTAIAIRDYRISACLPLELLSAKPKRIALADKHGKSLLMAWEIDGVQSLAYVTKKELPLFRTVKLVNRRTGDLKQYRQLDPDGFMNGELAAFYQWEAPDGRRALDWAFFMKKGVIPADTTARAH